MSAEEPVCPRCSRRIRAAESTVFSGGQIAHLNCASSRSSAATPSIPDPRPEDTSRREVER